MDFQQAHGYMRPPPPPQPPGQPLPPLSMAADPYHHLQPQRLSVPPPNHWYSTQFQYQHSSPSPPPPPPHPQPLQQWAPPPLHSDHFALPPPLPPYSAPSPYLAHHPLPHNHYPPPPPPPPQQLPPLPPRPHIPAPQIPQSYPQVNQDWTNANWGHHQSWDYQASTNEEVWAAKARAWAAAKVASDSQQGQQPYAFKDANATGDSNAVFSGRDVSRSPLVHQQEVPSSYSSIAGDPVVGIDPIAAMPSDYTFAPPAEATVVYPSVPAVLQSGPQVDLSAAAPSPVSGHSAAIFGRIPGPSFQTTPVSTPFGMGAGPELHPITAFSADAYGVSGVSDRPKKASVPNWLREEIIKKKAVVVSSAAGPLKEDAQSIEDEGVDKSFAKGDQADSKSIDSSRSTEDEDDDEDEMEAARIAAINQEIKRVLTEVLLKVTDELFDEIATKVFSEDDLAVEADNAVTVSDHKAPIPVTLVPTSNASAKDLAPVKIKESNSYIASEKSASSSPGDVLGLANYASEDNEDNEIQSSEKSKLKGNGTKQQTTSIKFSKGMDVVGNGNSQEENKENLDNPGIMESDPGSSIPNARAINHDGAAELVKEGSGREPAHYDPHISTEMEFGVAENSARDGFDAPHSKETLGSKAVLKAEKPVENVIHKSDADDSLGHESRNKSDKKDKHEDRRKSTGKDHNIKENAYEITYESHSRHDERNTKKERKNDENGSKDRTKDKGVKPTEKAKDSDSRKRSSPDYVKESRKEKQTDSRASLKEDSGRKKERMKDDNREKPRHTNAGESSKHKRHRSSSDASRGRDNNDGHVVTYASDSSDESSDNSRKKLHLKRQKSPSSVRSKKRQVSRSPHSKHSQHRHSPYSSLETARGRRSRSRSRSPIRRRR